MTETNDLGYWWDMKISWYENALRITDYRFFVKETQRLPVDSHHKKKIFKGLTIFMLVCTICWTNNRVFGDFRRDSARVMTV